ncbi:MAG: OmpA family protein [Acidimicrobiia bacterium]|nr:OmpA family protein [Acidimicrobiia bacterium]
MADERTPPPDHDPGTEISEHVNDYLESLRARFDELADRIEEASQASIDRSRAELEEMINTGAPPESEIVDEPEAPAEAEPGRLGPPESPILAARLRELTEAEAAESGTSEAAAAEEPAAEPPTPEDEPDDRDEAAAGVVVIPVAAPPQSPEPAVPVAPAAVADVPEPKQPRERRPVPGMPRPVISNSNNSRRWVVVSLLGLILLSLAFLAGRWWSNRDTGTTATPTTQAPAPTTAAPSDQPDPAPDDEAIRTAVAGAVTALAPTGVSFTVDDGVVQLTGAVPDEATRAALSDVLQAISGVRTINNFLEVAVVEPPTQEELQAAADAAVAAAGFNNLKVSVVDGVATISGVVPVDVVGTGIFNAIEPLRSSLDGIAGIDSVVTRVQLRGDEASLRSELKELIDESPIIFASASSELNANATATLDVAAEIINAYPGLRVLIAGHADPSGAAEQNEALAAARGQAVLGYLISRGVAVTRIQAVSYGELFPEAGSDLGVSRRIEFEVAP